MTSDFAGARIHLEQARRCVSGFDEASLKIREAIDLLIEAAINEHHRRRDENLIEFPSHQV